MRFRAWFAAFASACAAAGTGCAASPPQDDKPTAAVVVPFVEAPQADATVAASATPSVDPNAPKPYRRPMKKTLDLVSKVRKLPIKEDVKAFGLNRDALLDKTKKKMTEELPPGVIEMQGEVLRGLGLVPVDYDLESGFLKLVTARVAGFYDPDEKAMYLLDDLSVAQEEETLPHELVHALQDQSFNIKPLLDYQPGQNDRLSAIQHLVEGDATIAGMVITYGDDFDADTDALRTAFLLSTQMSPVGAETPPIIIASLISPYTDGFAFAKALRAQGNWKAIDDAFRNLPETTEQTLHPDKYRAKEKALAVPAVPVSRLGDFKIGLDDTNGELGLRLMLEQWTPFRVATRAAEGWGGDRLIVAQGVTAKKTYAIALYTKMDSVTDAHEVAKVLTKQFGSKCVERKDLGPFSWTMRGADIVIVAGPYERTAKGAKSAGDCKLADAWLKDILAAK